MSGGALAGEAEKFAARNGIGAAAVHFGSMLSEQGEVAAEQRFLRQGVLQTSEVGRQSWRGRGGEGVDAPRTALHDRNEAVAAQVGEVTGDFRLWQPQYRLEMTDAQRPLCQQVEQAQPGGITQAVVKFEQLQSLQAKRLFHIRQGKYAGVARMSLLPRLVHGECNAGESLLAPA